MIDLKKLTKLTTKAVSSYAGSKNELNTHCLKQISKLYQFHSLNVFWVYFKMEC